LLADHGAEAIKIEAPGAPHALREWGKGRGEQLLAVAPDPQRTGVSALLTNRDGQVTASSTLAQPVADRSTLR
jgi:crotonobetainyl-CoA:carnitine CoA-transferase CaiB-like acyl-CoA transferase